MTQLVGQGLVVVGAEVLDPVVKDPEVDRGDSALPEALRHQEEVHFVPAMQNKNPQ